MTQVPSRETWPEGGTWIPKNWGREFAYLTWTWLKIRLAGKWFLTCSPWQLISLFPNYAIWQTDFSGPQEIWSEPCEILLSHSSVNTSPERSLLRELRQRQMATKLNKEPCGRHCPSQKCSLDFSTFLISLSFEFMALAKTTDACNLKSNLSPGRHFKHIDITVSF